MNIAKLLPVVSKQSKAPHSNYYVTWGKERLEGIYASPIQACIDLLQDHLAHNHISSLPVVFIVSTHGFGEHDDDLFIPLQWVLEQVNGWKINLEESENSACKESG